MTELDVITHALRLLGVVASDEAATADQEAFCRVTLDAITAEFQEYHLLPWSTDNVPARSSQPLALLLAADAAPSYLVAPPMSRGMAKLRLLATVNPDDREPDSEA